MNLQAAYDTPGYWQQVKGTPTKYNIQSGEYGPYALGKMQDNTGAIVDIMFSGGKDAPLPQGSLLNKPCLWAVRFDANTQKYKAIFKQYASNDVPQNTPQGPQAPPQAPNVPQQAPNAPQQASDVNRQELTKQRSIERQCAWKGACARFQGMEGFPDEDVVRLAAMGNQFIQTGRAPQNYPNPDPSIQNGPQDNPENFGWKSPASDDDPLR